MYGMMTLRALPEEQRRVWRTMFDHYVFGVNGDPAAHLLEDVRGVLGARSPQQVARMRATLRQALQAP